MKFRNFLSMHEDFILNNKLQEKIIGGACTETSYWTGSCGCFDPFLDCAAGPCPGIVCPGDGQ